jgi:hypothetical protein
LDYWKVPGLLVDRVAFEEQTSTHPGRIKNVENRFDNDKDDRHRPKRITLESHHKGFWKTRNGNYLEERTEILAKKEINILPGASDTVIFQISAEGDRLTPKENKVDKSEPKGNQNSGNSNIAFPEVSSNRKERSEQRTGMPELSTTKKSDWASYLKENEGHEERIDGSRKGLRQINSGLEFSHGIGIVLKS